MNFIRMLVLYLGRICLSSIFLISAVQEMLDWSSTEQYFLTSMTHWMNSFQPGEGFAVFLSNLFPWLPWILLIAVVLKLVGSVLLILGCSVRLAATLLILFLVPTTIIVHGFWHVSPQDRALETVMFMKNLSIFGGLLVVLVFGKGSAAAKAH